MLWRKAAVFIFSLLLWQAGAAQARPESSWKQFLKAITRSEERQSLEFKNSLENVPKGAAKTSRMGKFSRLLGLRALWGAKKLRQQQFEKEVHYSVFQVLDNDRQPFGTGFVFVRPDGSGQIWAAAAGHLTKQIGQKVPVRFYIGDGDYLPAFFIVKARGSVGFHNPDMVLMEVPAWVHKYIKPLKVDLQPVRLGDKVDSYGYHGPFIGSQLIKTAGRKIIASDGWQIRTTYNFGNKDGFAQGACGSPVIKNGKVIGLHIGSYFGKYSYVLNFPRVSQFLFDQMEGKPSLIRDVIVNGHYITSLTLTQRVSDVEIFRNGEKLTEICITQHPEPVDYRHLERSLPVLRKGDLLRFRITTDGQDQRDFITYTIQ